MSKLNSLNPTGNQLEFKRMTNEGYKKKCRNEAIETAKGILLGSMEPIDGIRKLFEIHFELEGIPEFNYFCGLYSETDVYPRGDVRGLYEKSFLERLDLSEQNYLAEHKEFIEDACADLIRALSNR